MGEKTKAKKAESSHEKSSASELKPLGSTSSIAIPKDSALKKLAIAGVVLLGLGSGGYFFSKSEKGQSLLHPAAGVAEYEADNASTPAKEGLPPVTGMEASKDAALPPQGSNASAGVQAPTEAAKKAAVTKASKSKAGKAALSKKAKKQKAIAKLKAKKSGKTKALAVKKKAKMKKTPTK